jgi:hypothetical protein
MEIAREFPHLALCRTIKKISVGQCDETFGHRNPIVKLI